MATTDFRGDISAAIRKFMERNKTGVPRVLIVTAEDAMIWHSADGSRESTRDFLDHQVRSYLATVSCNGQKLRDCRVELSTADSGEQTRFE
jgi:hypothetical protein